MTGVGTDTITIDLDQSLYPETTYYILIGAGVIEDLAGNDFAGITSSSTWSFTTADAGSTNRIAVSPSSATIAEDGGTEQFAFTLDEPIIVAGEGSEILTLYIMIDDTNEAILSTTTISWTTSTWHQTRYVTTTGVNDNTEGNDSANIYWVVSTDAEYYQGFSGSIALTLTDDDIAPPSALSYTSPNVYTVSTAITPLSPIITGVATSFEVSPALPAGLLIDQFTGVISGTPTSATSVTVYTVTASNAGGDTTFDITITVNNVDTPSQSGGGSYVPPTPPTVSFTSTFSTTEPDADGASMSGAFAINSGAAETNKTAVTLNFTDIVNASQVALSESSSFAGVSYQVFTPSRPFTLSPGNGTKTVYAKLRSPDGASLILKDTILLTTSETETPINPDQALQCTSNVYLTNPVKIGANNNPADVRLLEEFLNTYEQANLPVNGIYDPADIAAVIAWQEKHAADILTPWGITQGTGYVFTTSLAKIKAIHKANCATAISAPTSSVVPTTTTACLNTTDTLRLGMNNAFVVTAQRLLKNLGYFPADIDTTGYFGPVTETTTRAFQGANDIDQVGFIGPQTRARLNELACTAQ